MARNDLWIHGVNTQIEYPSNVFDGGDRTVRGFPRKMGRGLRVRQEAGTTNWFHLAIPTLRVYKNDDSIYLETVAIQVDLNENAKITAVHLWDGNERVESKNDLDLRGPSVYYTFENRHRVLRGIVVCIFVEFLTYREGGPMGQADFIGAGAKFTQYG